ncbi:MAG: PTS sugar transporter subunit IIB [Anaeromicrobium sp.]|jgi:PTS system ascorbate-specific IIB component|uniref:PTS sugar transporter subunit IIB n=1 Tax=Anaeromicrobium sp. TaxID=1929132 RepID=UPI0025FE5107|nr:PTS sugar transporter subunit IIB [Anaeromicrobium sp.]MCT4594363.1 PTS sugar transporter subunit IIB [Anaeromicrobium sp.]
MKKILVACGNGVGSSLIVKMKVQKVFADMNIPCDITHSSIGQAKSEASKFDFIVISKMFLKEFDNVIGPKVIGLVNILSEDELKEKLIEAME